MNESLEALIYLFVSIIITIIAYLFYHYIHWFDDKILEIGIAFIAWVTAFISLLTMRPLKDI